MPRGLVPLLGCPFLVPLSGLPVLFGTGFAPGPVRDRGVWAVLIFVDRLWRTVKYEELYPFYNDQRPHQALGYRVPAEVSH